MCTCFHCPVRVHILSGACLLARDDARPTSYSAEDQAGVFYTTRASIGNLATTCCIVCYAVLGRARATVRCSNSQPVALRDAPVAIAQRRCSSTMFQFGILPWAEPVTPNDAPVAIVKHGHALACQRGGPLFIRSLNCESSSRTFVFLPAHRFSPARWG